MPSRAEADAAARAPRPRWRGALRAFALWTAVGLFFAVQVRLESAYAREALTWAQAVGSSLLEWYVWMAAFPLLLGAARRFPLERGRWLRGLLLHVPLSMVLTLVKVNLVHGLAVASGVLPARQPDMSELNASLLTSWVLIGLAQVLVQQRGTRERERRALELESQLAEARLAALRSQLQPHFLFNTLNAVSALMHRDVSAADTVLAKLSDLLRLALERGDRSQVSLHDELSFTRLYADIQRTRFAERFRFEERVDPELLDALVPTLILQPLVENAVQHGVARQSAPVAVVLSARAVDGMLCLGVEDDGPGPGAVSGRGVGLSNVAARLEQLHGDAARLELRRLDSCTRVELTLPLQHGPALGTEDSDDPDRADR